MKVSVIDLGFNSVKLVNYDVKEDGCFRAYQQEGVKVRLGEGMQETGRIASEPAARTAEALRLFRDMIKFDRISHVLPVATSAVREAANRDEFLSYIERNTGFRFKVLSEQEEAIYSYIGALQSTCIPTALFFDIGGGSLELVYTENYSIKRIKSYPLGALRLTQMFGKSDGSFSKKAYGRMRRHVEQTLPGVDDLGLSPDTELVGVGGALRAIARYDQEVIAYELDKIHNYRMEYSDVSSISEDLYRMGPEKIESVKAIGSNRIQTIIAGSTAITILMQKMGLENIIVSAQGLREGILSVYIRDPDGFKEPITAERARSFVLASCRPEVLPARTRSMVMPLQDAGLMREREKMILTHAIRELHTLPPTANLNNLFYMMIDEDNRFLTHREQLILALSIIYTRKGKTADWIFSRYRTILESQNKRSIEKIAACLTLSSIIERTGIRLQFRVMKGKKIDMKVTSPSKRYMPQMLLKNAVANFEQAFGIPVALKLEVRNQHWHQGGSKLTERLAI
jgi:exopolyphosphatase/guanosine-5'-triphosphate,3'-diphosphate pyrophosphatase